jgi:hypothetical protein
MVTAKPVRLEDYTPPNLLFTSYTTTEIRQGIRGGGGGGDFSLIHNERN